MLIDLAKVRQYHLLDEPIPLEKLKLRHEHPCAEKCETHVEAAIQTE